LEITLVFLPLFARHLEKWMRSVRGVPCFEALYKFFFTFSHDTQWEFLILKQIAKVFTLGKVHNLKLYPTLSETPVKYFDWFTFFFFLKSKTIWFSFCISMWQTVVTNASHMIGWQILIFHTKLWISKHTKLTKTNENFEPFIINSY
jgi:hypothetical protein